MSSHDCTLSGTLLLKDGVDNTSVERALKPFFDWAKKAFEDEVENGNISIDSGGSLYLRVDYHSIGGDFRIDELEQSIEALGQIVSEPGVLEVRDFDSGNVDAMLVPHFVGATARARGHAQIEYGISACATWNFRS
jgi:hypothetical protein